ncbi:glycoside hydrolase family 1 protein [Bombilactobacillus folatiphilus]|uniref:Glycoside hydrolase family 1 protein n=1 Tax=Bombilactobacillus folatiphilus TaxID=2923362 RepID=A0ABY4PB97_9LACO|nr:glycoside hydrolase family 1 protein [Bombilactobacillus folatiphilus]UQS82801.1 glycoside hydrolase family 1 protein [Bombilactobacillus folatiphilus]
MSRTMPESFLWGNSTSSMQTEGAFDEGGKGKSVYDTYPATAHSSDWHVAIDEYHRYLEDFDLMAQQGINCYRFQISWSRVNPQGDGDFNSEGIDFYSRMIDELLARGIQPMICLYHFDMPLHLAEKYNGFIDRHVVKAFVRYAQKMIDLFGDRVQYWLTFNEQNLYLTTQGFKISGYLHGPRSSAELFKITHHLFVAHAQIANYLHAKTNAQIGGMLAYSEVYPVSADPKDNLFARQIDEFMNKNFLDVFVNGKYSTEVQQFIANQQIDIDWQTSDQALFNQLSSDFIAFSYYQSLTISSRLVPAGMAPNLYLDYGAKENPFLNVNEWGWSIDPLGFRDVLSKTYNQYHIPMFPIENGLGVREEYHGEILQDDYRIAYHRAHLQALQDAMFEDGVQVLGYLGWGLIDIPSSSGNMDKRYGMVYVNRTNHDLRDLQRIPKQSYWWFQKVIQSNGANLD